jgi:hypothetical protein
MSPCHTSPTTLSTDSVNNFPRFGNHRWYASQSVLGLLFLVTFSFAPVPQVTANELASEAASYLTVETVLDGRCHNLSEGGKLAVLRNTHPSKTIRYRLLRLFIDRPQGLLDGSLAPAEGVQKLGCDKVGGRAQTWRVKRARFAQE